MEENIIKIENLLSKDILSKEDQEAINKLVATDPSAKEFYYHYLEIKNIVNESSHLSGEEIGKYILRIEGNLEGDNLSGVKFNKIKEHLKGCKKCSAMFLELTQEYTETGSFIEKSLVTATQRKQEVLKHRVIINNNIFRYSFASVLSAAALYAVLMLTSSIVIPETTQLAKIEDNALNFITRGRATDDFQKGLAALDNNDFREAVDYFNSDVKQNVNNESIFYTYYVLGLTYLELSEKDFIGLFPSYNEKEVKLAIESFDKCINENISGNYPDISANAYYYQAKAELMLDNKTAAVKSFQKVIELKGSKLDKAREILKVLE